MAGYSGTPLAKKLGIKDGGRLFVSSAPANYPSLLEPLPDGVTMVTRLDQSVDMAHVFTVRRAELQKVLRAAVRHIRAVALPMGLVDIKVCAIDEVWSGLKLVIRKERRR